MKKFLTVLLVGSAFTMSAMSVQADGEKKEKKSKKETTEKKEEKKTEETK